MTAVCIKVHNLRKLDYPDLDTWMADPQNVYTGRAGRIFITDAETKERRMFYYTASKWQNPFRLNEYSLDESLRRYVDHLHASGLILEIEELRGKNLGCFCERARAVDGTPVCHAEILSGLLKSKRPEKTIGGDITS